VARLVIALDGLSRPQLRLLAGELAWFRALSASGELVDVDSRPLPCAQVAWAQLLTGAVWYQTGCAGWAVPAGSLGHLEVITDKHLQRPVTFPQKVNGRLFIANIPLFAPAGRQMAWLADGSLPLPSTVSPAELLKNARVAAYKPRPFSGLVFAIGEPFRAALACLDNEIERLETVLEVLRGKEWELVIIRLTLFDLLAHLLGPEFLDQAEHQLYETILSGLRKLDSLLDAISNTVPNTTVYGISMYSHATPVACVDLNLILLYLLSQ